MLFSDCSISGFCKVAKFSFRTDIFHNDSLGAPCKGMLLTADLFGENGKVLALGDNDWSIINGTQKRKL